MQAMNASRVTVLTNYTDQKLDDIVFNGVVARIQINESAHPPDYGSCSLNITKTAKKIGGHKHIRFLGCRKKYTSFL